MQVSERKSLTVDAKTMPDILALLNHIVESAFPRWWFVGTGLDGERRQGGWLSTQLTRFNDDDHHRHHHHLHNWPGSMMMITNIIIILQLTSWAIIGCTSFVPSCIKLFCLPELPQRRWWEAGWTHFAKWRSMPPQHHWILWLEHRPGILNHNVGCESTSWLIIFAQTNISQKCWRPLAFLTTQFDNFRITPASVTSTTLPKSTVWTLCGRWRGSTSTSTGGSLRWSPPVLLDRYPPIPAMSLSWCWFLSFFFSPLLTRWGRCTRRLQQASR